MQGYAILKDTCIDCKHLLAYGKGYEILNIYDNELLQIQAFQDSIWLGIPLTRAHAKMYHSKNESFLAMFPWIEDSNFHLIIEGFNDGSTSFSTASCTQDGYMNGLGGIEG